MKIKRERINEWSHTVFLMLKKTWITRLYKPHCNAW